MNLLGRRSLSSVFKLLLDVAFYGACLAGVLSVIAAVLAWRTNTSKVSLTLPVRFEIAPSAYRRAVRRRPTGGRDRPDRTLRSRRRGRRDYRDRHRFPRHGAAVRRSDDDAGEPRSPGVIAACDDSASQAEEKTK